MKKKYIKPYIETIVVCAECSVAHAASYQIYDNTGTLIDRGTVEDGMPGDADEEDRNDLNGLANKANYNPWDF